MNYLPIILIETKSHIFLELGEINDTFIHCGKKAKKKSDLQMRTSTKGKMGICFLSSIKIFNQGISFCLHMLITTKLFLLSLHLFTTPLLFFLFLSHYVASICPLSPPTPPMSLTVHLLLSFHISAIKTTKLLNL